MAAILSAEHIAAMRDRLRRYYSRYNEAKIDQVDEILALYEYDEEVLFRELTDRYGPEPLATAGQRIETLPIVVENPPAVSQLLTSMTSPTELSATSAPKPDVQQPAQVVPAAPSSSAARVAALLAKKPSSAARPIETADEKAARRRAEALAEIEAEEASLRASKGLPALAVVASHPTASVGQDTGGTSAKNQLLPSASFSPLPSKLGSGTYLQLPSSPSDVYNRLPSAASANAVSVSPLSESQTPYRVSRLNSKADPHGSEGGGGGEGHGGEEGWAAEPSSSDFEGRDAATGRHLFGNNGLFDTSANTAAKKEEQEQVGQPQTQEGPYSSDYTSLSEDNDGANPFETKLGSMATQKKAVVKEPPQPPTAAVVSPPSNAMLLSVPTDPEEGELSDAPSSIGRPTALMEDFGGGESTGFGPKPSEGGWRKRASSMALAAQSSQPQAQTPPAVPPASIHFPTEVLSPLSDRARRVSFAHSLGNKSAAVAAAAPDKLALSPSAADLAPLTGSPSKSALRPTPTTGTDDSSPHVRAGAVVTPPSPSEPGAVVSEANHDQPVNDQKPQRAAAAVADFETIRNLDTLSEADVAADAPSKIASSESEVEASQTIFDFPRVPTMTPELKAKMRKEAAAAAVYNYNDDDDEDETEGESNQQRPASPSTYYSQFHSHDGATQRNTGTLFGLSHALQLTASATNRGPAEDPLGMPTWGYSDSDAAANASRGASMANNRPFERLASGSSDWWGGSNRFGTAKEQAAADASVSAVNEIGAPTAPQNLTSQSVALNLQNESPPPRTTNAPSAEVEKVSWSRPGPQAPLQAPSDSTAPRELATHWAPPQLHVDSQPLPQPQPQRAYIVDPYALFSIPKPSPFSTWQDTGLANTNASQQPATSVDLRGIGKALWGHEESDERYPSNTLEHKQSYLKRFFAIGADGRELSQPPKEADLSMASKPNHSRASHSTSSALRRRSDYRPQDNDTIATTHLYSDRLPGVSGSVLGGNRSANLVNNPLQHSYRDPNIPDVPSADIRNFGNSVSPAPQSPTAIQETELPLTEIVPAPPLHSTVADDHTSRTATFVARATAVVYNKQSNVVAAAAGRDLVRRAVLAAENRLPTNIITSSTAAGSPRRQYLLENEEGPSSADGAEATQLEYQHPLSRIGPPVSDTQLFAEAVRSGAISFDASQPSGPSSGFMRTDASQYHHNPTLTHSRPQAGGSVAEQNFALPGVDGHDANRFDLASSKPTVARGNEDPQPIPEWMVAHMERGPGVASRKGIAVAPNLDPQRGRSPKAGGGGGLYLTAADVSTHKYSAIDFAPVAVMDRSTRSFVPYHNNSDLSRHLTVANNTAASTQSRSVPNWLAPHLTQRQSDFTVTGDVPTAQIARKNIIPTGSYTNEHVPADPRQVPRRNSLGSVNQQQAGQQPIAAAVVPPEQPAGLIPYNDPREGRDTLYPTLYYDDVAGQKALARRPMGSISDSAASVDEYGEVRNGPRSSFHSILKSNPNLIGMVEVLLPPGVDNTASPPRLSREPDDRAPLVTDDGGEMKENSPPRRPSGLTIDEDSSLIQCLYHEGAMAKSPFLVSQRQNRFLESKIKAHQDRVTMEGGPHLAPESANDAHTRGAVRRSSILSAEEQNGFAPNQVKIGGAQHIKTLAATGEGAKRKLSIDFAKAPARMDFSKFLDHSSGLSARGTGRREPMPMVVPTASPSASLPLSPFLQLSKLSQKQEIATVGLDYRKITPQALTKEEGEAIVERRRLMEEQKRERARPSLLQQHLQTSAIPSSARVSRSATPVAETSQPKPQWLVDALRRRQM